MLISHRWRSKTALLIALGMTSMTAFPILTMASATALPKPYSIAQLFSQSQQVVVPAGTVIPVKYDEADKIVVAPDDKTPVTLTVAANIRSASGTILLREGTQIKGELRPAEGGTQFVAQELIFRNTNRRLPIDATSRTITERETIKKGANVSSILTGAAVGAGAAAALSEIFGDIDAIKVIGGAGAGALAGLLLGGRRQTEVIVVRPNTDLDLTLQSDLVLR
jgi:hypothetical protein